MNIYIYIYIPLEVALNKIFLHWYVHMIIFRNFSFRHWKNILEQFVEKKKKRKQRIHVKYNPLDYLARPLNT